MYWSGVLPRARSRPLHRQQSWPHHHRVAIGVDLTIRPVGVAIMLLLALLLLFVIAHCIAVRTSDVCDACNLPWRRGARVLPIDIPLRTAVVVPALAAILPGQRSVPSFDCATERRIPVWDNTVSPYLCIHRASTNRASLFAKELDARTLPQPCDMTSWGFSPASFQSRCFDPLSSKAKAIVAALANLSGFESKLSNGISSAPRALIWSRKLSFRPKTLNWAMLCSDAYHGIAGDDIHLFVDLLGEPCIVARFDVFVAWDPMAPCNRARTSHPHRL